MPKTKTLEDIQKSAKIMREHITLTQVLVSSMEMIEELPEDQRDPAWEAIFLLVDGAKLTGVPIAEG